jgi:hypothetical protein
MANETKNPEYGPLEIERRREAALKKMLATPHKPHAPKAKKKLSRLKKKAR